ncbi:unnamed protein product [Chondrus crispus]|uniref:Uncharacterized protein n=1 Tax=Chondrus crispus TaxID=2769 RepID=R7QE82_CHOCR|nr:unnamed protein product [Chondrus crispus]CDF35740.1 unnamed protein product [Chondrus crispus]|eukprot:XP_005715559.1 unnamed protein product [Chondrus crispus]
MHLHPGSEGVQMPFLRPTCQRWQHSRRRRRTCERRPASTRQTVTGSRLLCHPSTRVPCWRRKGGRKAARVGEREKIFFRSVKFIARAGVSPACPSVPLVAGCRGAPLSLIEGPPASSTSQDRRPLKGDCPRVHLAYT